MKTSEVRQRFVNFFQSKKHTFVPSSSLIPYQDKTILFTIAGMTQFKHCLTGEEKRDYKRATNSQKCVRAADLDDVGKDGRHLTFFEMLGSWSFGDYYKKEAIQWAYEFVKDELKLDLKNFWATVHHSDDEAYEIWKSLGVPENRIRRLGDKDNFWAMGPTGPCGPCSELYIDQGPSVGKCNDKTFDCKAGPGCDCDRYLEFWNLVFMQFNRQEDGTLLDLPIKSVDTGSGLERMAALVQGKTSAFDIDIFIEMKEAILKQAFPDKKLTDLNHEQAQAIHVIADHIRMLTFSLADGATFSNEGRGYVLRRVLRRAVRYAHLLTPSWNKKNSFLAPLVSVVVKEMGEFYTELPKNQKRIEESISLEELKFTVTLESGLQKLEQFFSEMLHQHEKTLSGSKAFILHDSFGFPFDLTKILCEEKKFYVDLDGFEKAMQEQKDRSREEAKFYQLDKDDSPWIYWNALNQTEDKKFNGYFLKPNLFLKETEYYSTEISKNQLKQIRLLKNKMFELIFSNTPFYPEGGGQVCDSGFIQCSSLSGDEEFEVINVIKTPSAIVHLLRYCNGSLVDNENVTLADFEKLFQNAKKWNALVDMKKRMSTARHHTATHLLHKALQVFLGDSVHQAGSLVTPQGLRFDFSYNKSLTEDDIFKIENLVNQEILKNIVVDTHEDINIDHSKTMGAQALFSEKYEDKVRVLQIGQFSVELCGGTHVQSTGEIGLFKILHEGSVTNGVRRIEAVAGFSFLEKYTEIQNYLSQTAKNLKCAEKEILSKIDQLKESNKETEKQIVSLRSRLANEKLNSLLQKAKILRHNISLISEIFYDDVTLDEVLILADKVKENPNKIGVFFVIQKGKGQLLVCVNPEVYKAHPDLSANFILKKIGEKLNGKGGGKPDFARGSFTNISLVKDIEVQLVTLVE